MENQKLAVFNVDCNKIDMDFYFKVYTTNKSSQVIKSLEKEPFLLSISKIKYDEDKYKLRMNYNGAIERNRLLGRVALLFASKVIGNTIYTECTQEQRNNFNYISELFLSSIRESRG